MALRTGDKIPLFELNDQVIIKYIFNSQMRIDKHISESLRILKELE